MSLDTVTLRRRLQQALGKEFTVGDLLGEGGFAAVFRVREQPLNRDVAVKVIDLGLTPSPSLAVRFVREARTGAQLEHPHIVPIYKVGGHKNEVLYIVMRCLDGPSLRQLLEKYGRLSVGAAGGNGGQGAGTGGGAAPGRPPPPGAPPPARPEGAGPLRGGPAQTAAARRAPPGERCRILGA